MVTVVWKKLRAMPVCTMAVMPLVISSCNSLHESKDFERHRFSQIEMPYDRKDIFYFDVTITASYPDGNPAAEEKRMEWLSGWLEQRKLCPNGFEVLNRREFDYLEDNPARYDLRYEVRCRTEPED